MTSLTNSIDGIRPRCASCGAAPVPLATGARFCPGCGAMLRPSADTEATTTRPTLAQRLGMLARGAGHRVASRQHSSHILLAYAYALLRMGRRYEGATGAQRNPTEAVRCYAKSARLGNADALARLTPPETDPAVAAADPARVIAEAERLPFARPTHGPQ